MFRILSYSIIVLRNLNNYEDISPVQEVKSAGAHKNGSLGARTGMASCASSGGEALTKENKTPSKKTLTFPAPISKAAVPHWIKFLDQEAGHVGGNRKAGGSGRKFMDACERSSRTLSNIRRSRGPNSSNGELKVVESTQISTKGHEPQLAFRRRRFAADCLAEGTKRTQSGSEGMVLDELDAGRDDSLGGGEGGWKDQSRQVSNWGWFQIRRFLPIGNR